MPQEIPSNHSPNRKTKCWHWLTTRETNGAYGGSEWYGVGRQGLYIDVFTCFCFCEWLFNDSHRESTLWGVFKSEGKYYSVMFIVSLPPDHVLSIQKVDASFCYILGSCLWF